MGKISRRNIRISKIKKRTVIIMIRLNMLETMLKITARRLLVVIIRIIVIVTKRMVFINKEEYQHESR